MMQRLLVITVLVAYTCTEVMSHTKEPAVPLCLSKMSGKTLELQTKGLDVLKEIGDEPVVVVCIAGPARTGKSYFLSKLSDNADFEVGHGIMAKTAGIWISANAEMIDKEGGKARLVLLDTEGIGSITGDKDGMDKWDTSIVSLCTLTSSVLIYNSNRIPSQHDLQKLHFFSMFGNAMGSDDTKFRTRETLVWLIQDNTLIMEEYPDWTTFFEKEVFIDTDSSAPNEIIAGIKKMFPKFYAIALPPPSVNRTICKDLNNDEYKDELRFFLSEVDNAAEEIISMAAIKLVGGDRISGNKFSHLLKAWVDGINEQSSKFSWKSLFEMEQRYVCDERIKECKSQFNHEVKLMSLGTEINGIRSMMDIEKNVRECFDKLAISMESVRKDFLEKLTLFMADEKSTVLKNCAKTQFQKLMDEYKLKIDLIDWEDQETKLSDFVGDIDRIAKETIRQFELQNIAGADPLAEHRDKVNAQIERTKYGKDGIVHQWMEYHFDIFPHIHEEKLRNFDLDESRDSLGQHIAEIREETLSHFEMNGMKGWPSLRKNMDELNSKIDDQGATFIQEWKELHKWDAATAFVWKIRSIAAAGATAAGVGFLAGGPPGAVIGAASSTVTGSGWAVYDYITADD